MKIVYDMSVDDYVGFNIFHHKHSRSLRRSLIIGGVVSPVCIFLFFLLIGIKGGQLGVVILPGVIVPGLFALWILGGNRRRIARVVRKMFKEGENKMDIGLQELEVTSEGLTEKNEFGESKFNWKAIERIASTPDYYYIYISAMKALVVPKLKVTEGDFEEFRRLVEEGFRGAASIDGRTFDEKKIASDAKPVYRGDPGRKSCLCGVVSLAGGVLAAAFYGLVIGMVIVAGVSRQGEEAVEAPPSGAYLIMVAIGANLLGVIYSISGLVKANQKKLLPIIGLVVNCGVIFLIGMLVLAIIIFG